MKYVKIVIIFLVFVNFELVHRIKTANASSIERNFNNSSVNCTLTFRNDLLCQGDGTSKVQFDLSFLTSSLKNLRFVELNIDDFNISKFDDVRENLEFFAIENCRLTSTVDLSSNHTWKKLKTLKFTGNTFGSAFVKLSPISTLSQFEKIAPNLTTLNLTGNKIENDKISLDFSNFASLLHLDLSNNDISDVPRLPVNLVSLNLTENSIAKIRSGTFSNVTQLKDINFSRNRLLKIAPDIFINGPNGVQRLNFSHNFLSTIGDIFANLTDLETLDLSNNQIETLESSSFQLSTRLKILMLQNNPLTNLEKFPLLSLEYLDLSRIGVEVLHMDIFVNLRSLKTLLLQSSRQLRSIAGNVGDMSSLELFNVKNCSLKIFPADFFIETKKKLSIDVSDNPWPCDCRILWTTNVKLFERRFKNIDKTFCIRNNGEQILLSNVTNVANFTQTCSFGTVSSNGTILRAKYGTHILLDCGSFGDRFPKVTWRRADLDVQLPSYNGELLTKNLAEKNVKYVPYADGTVRILSVDKTDSGVYECTIDNVHGNVTVYFSLRLSYAATWWFIKWASLICGILTALGFFALNMIYSAIRRLVLWRLSEMEQTSRMRCLLESMEKYRQRQMENLHEIYTSNINQVRENYHQQVEQLRKSYGGQIERFRDYRTAQIESVAHHIDSLRDNYGSQMNRVRDYGGKQMERLWESYQSRVNRLREFSLHQRLRLMSQYKIKQRYLNKLLETLNVESCRYPSSRRTESIIIGPELIELPRIMPDDDMPSTTFNGRDDFLSLSQPTTASTSFFDQLHRTASKSNMFIMDDDDGLDELGLQDFEEDATSFYSFPEDTSTNFVDTNLNEEEAALDPEPRENSTLIPKPAPNDERRDDSNLITLFPETKLELSVIRN